nr:hypothetical protein DBT45_11755 [Aerococcus tenax]
MRHRLRAGKGQSFAAFLPEQMHHVSAENREQTQRNPRRRHIDRQHNNPPATNPRGLVTAFVPFWQALARLAKGNCSRDLSAAPERLATLPPQV